MGFSVAAAAAILFAGGLLSFSVVVQSLDSAAESVREARAQEEARALDRLNTHLTLLNGTANGSALELNFTNDGSVLVHVSTLEVLVNGTLATANVTLREVDGAAATNLWAPGQRLHLRLAWPALSPVSVKLVTDAGYALVAQVS